MRVTAATQVPPPPPTSVDRGSVAAAHRNEPVRADDEVHHDRLQAVVEMIKRLTGRDVKFVPPSPYFVSGPPRPEPVELQLATLPPRAPERSVPDDPETPVTVDITDVVERGTTPRMRLVSGGDGTLSLHPELNIDV